jgi:hypothetical protein
LGDDEGEGAPAWGRGPTNVESAAEEDESNPPTPPPLLWAMMAGVVMRPLRGSNWEASGW